MVCSFHFSNFLTLITFRQYFQSSKKINHRMFLNSKWSICHKNSWSFVHGHANLCPNYWSKLSPNF
jgi:hypothetical protein